MSKESHITLLGILHIVRGSILLLIGILAFLFFSGIGLFSGDPTALGILGLLGTVAVVFMFFLALPSIAAGIGLIKYQEWGRILALVVGFLSLLDVPIGTALGVYTIWVLMNDETKRMFERPQSPSKVLPVAPQG
jgi:hypothetical protein